MKIIHGIWTYCSASLAKSFKNNNIYKKVWMGKIDLIVQILETGEVSFAKPINEKWGQTKLSK